MDKQKQDPIERHHAGATVEHKGPFDHLTTPNNQKVLDQDFIEKFVQPFYMNLFRLGYGKNEIKGQVKAILPEISSDVVEKLLGDFNWRTRSVGAFFAALKGLTDFQDQIGRLLLKSEVCYAGASYCLALTEFNNQKSIEYLSQYLDYYLSQKDLWFDQGEAMGAIAYLDRQNGTNRLKKHLDKWTAFVSNKDRWDLQESIDLFEANMSALKEIKGNAR